MEAGKSMHDAAREGDIALLRRLPAAGADVNRADPFGGTPLYEVALGGYRDVVAERELLKDGSNVQAHAGKTP